MVGRIRRKLEAELRLQTLRAILYGRCSARDALMMTGSPRSGTTWLGNILSQIPNASILFEPIQMKHVPQSKRVGFSWRTYVPTTTGWQEGQRYMTQVMQGQVLNHWTTREMSIRQALSTRFLIIKFVRANRMLPWLCKNFPTSRAILIIRHPCAVIASQLREGSWGNFVKPEAPKFLADYPAFEGLIDRVKTQEQYMAINWAIDNYVPLASTTPQPWQLLVYEKLVSDFDEEVVKIFDEWKMEVPPQVTSLFNKPSSVTHRSGISGLSGWKKYLDKKQVRQILDITTAFGLDFYNDDVIPNYDRLYSPQLSDRLKAIGQGGKDQPNGEDF